MVKTIILVAALGAAPALAQTSFEGATTRRTESDRSQALEFKLGSIRPLIHRETALGGATPYKDAFGPTGMLLAEVELDWYFWQGFGAAGLGFSAGYTEKYGRAALIDPTTGAVTGAAADSTALFILPLRLHGLYRFDWAALRYGIPLVPYVKAGLNLNPWWITKGGEIEVVDGRRGAGAKFGYSGTAGLSLLLDVFEPRLARDFDSDLGVNHSYFFAEFTYADVNNFGAGGLDFSTRHFMFGLALEY